MKKILQFFVVMTLMALVSVSAEAASIGEQIAGAVAKKDYKTVQALVGGNPGSTGAAQGALLDSALDKLVKNPQEAAQAMTVASSLAKGLAPKDASAVAEKLKKIVKTIADKSLLICNPETSADSSNKQAPLDPKKAADAEAIMAVLSAAESIAEAPAIVAVAPELFAQIQEQSGQCETGEDALLAQRPGLRPGNIMPHLQNPGFPPPPHKQGSPD